jgi:hypothetical protein
MHVNPAGPAPLSYDEWTAKLQLRKSHSVLAFGIFAFQPIIQAHQWNGTPRVSSRHEISNFARLSRSVRRKPRNRALSSKTSLHDRPSSCLPNNWEDPTTSM